MDNEKEKLKENEVVTEAPPQTTTETVPETVNPPGTEEISPGVSPEESALEEMDESSVSETAEKEKSISGDAVEAAKDELANYTIRFYPDADVSTPEKLMVALLPLVKSTVSLHDDLYQVVEEFPEFGDFILGLRKGYTPQQAIAMYFDVESLTPPEGAEDEEAVRTAKEERRKKVETEKARLAKIPENQELTSKNFKNVVEKLGLKEEDQKRLVGNFESIINDFAQDGVVSENHWEMLANGLIHKTVLSEKEKEKEAAVEDARIAGRNEQIEKKRANKETGDGIPKLASTGSLPPKKEEDEFTAGLKKIANKKKVI